MKYIIDHNPIALCGMFHTPKNMRALEAWLEQLHSGERTTAMTAAMMMMNLAHKVIEQHKFPGIDSTDWQVTEEHHAILYVKQALLDILSGAMIDYWADDLRTPEYRKLFEMECGGSEDEYLKMLGAFSIDTVLVFLASPEKDWEDPIPITMRSMIEAAIKVSERRTNLNASQGFRECCILAAEIQIALNHSTGSSSLPLDFDAGDGDDLIQIAALGEITYG